jgi:hypothetical protein
MANGLINKELIMKAWTHLRKTEMTIPNETLDFMRDVALEKCAEMEACDWGKSNASENTLPIQRVSELLFEFNEWVANDRRSTTVKQLVDGFIKEKFK